MKLKNRVRKKKQQMILVKKFIFEDTKEIEIEIMAQKLKLKIFI